MFRKNPIHELPPNYREVLYLPLLEPGRVLLINLLALLPMGLALALTAAWYSLLLSVRGSRPGGPDWPWWFWLLLAVIVVLPLHEILHGLAIQGVGHKPRYGIKWSKGALYATTDNALFRRGEFIFVALTPLIGITLAGMALMTLLPDQAAYYVGIGVIFNAGGAIGDLWMAAEVLQHPATALVRDEADAIRIYERVTG